MELVGYTGCRPGTNSTDVDEDGLQDTPMGVTYGGFTLTDEDPEIYCHCVVEPLVYPSDANHRDLDENCNDKEQSPVEVDPGSYFCRWTAHDVYVDASPYVEFSVEPTCLKCAQAYDDDDEGGETGLTNAWGSSSSKVNDVDYCANCSMASAQAIRWDAWSSPLWNEPINTQITPSCDHNRVNGTIGGGGDTAFRGSSPTEVFITIIAAKYENLIDKIYRYAWRVQYSTLTEGDRKRFDTRINIYNGSTYTSEEMRDSSSDVYEKYNTGSLLSNWVVDDGFISEDTDNMVKLKVHFLEADVMLATRVYQKWASSDVMGTVGGLLSVLSGLIVFVMTKMEALKEHQMRAKELSGNKSDPVVFARHLLRELHHGIFSEHGTMVKHDTLDDEEEKRLLGVWDKMDTDGGGDLDVGELHKALKRLGKIRTSRRNAIELMREADADGNGRMSYKEFRSLFVEAPYTPSNPEDMAPIGLVDAEFEAKQKRKQEKFAKQQERKRRMSLGLSCDDLDGDADADDEFDDDDSDIDPSASALDLPQNTDEYGFTLDAMGRSTWPPSAADASVAEVDDDNPPGWTPDMEEVWGTGYADYLRARADDAGLTGFGIFSNDANRLSSSAVDKEWMAARLQADRDRRIESLRNPHGPRHSTRIDWSDKLVRIKRRKDPFQPTQRAPKFPGLPQVARPPRPDTPSQPPPGLGARLAATFRRSSGFSREGTDATRSHRSAEERERRRNERDERRRQRSPPPAATQATATPVEVVVVNEILDDDAEYGGQQPVMASLSDDETNGTAAQVDWSGKRVRIKRRKEDGPQRGASASPGSGLGVRPNNDDEMILRL